MKRVFPTRKELTKFTTREDLHKELQKFPTREELHKVIAVEIDAVEERLNEKISLLPTKEEFFGRMDKLSGEIEKVRQEQTLHAGDHQRIDHRLSRLEKKPDLPMID